LALAGAATLAVGASAANVKGTTYVDKTHGYSITIPAAWQLVPRPLAQVKERIALLKKKKATVDLSAALASIIATPAGRSQISAYEFQAFAWPFDMTATPILTEVYLGIVPVKTTLTKANLPAIGAEFANALSAPKGSKVVKPKEVDLPAGPTEYIIGTTPAGTGLATGFELYLIPHGKKLYELGFQVDSSLLSSAKLFTSIADDFKFV
jgi:hypothetical protein